MFTRNSFRGLTAIIAGLLLIPALAGCGSNGASDSAAETPVDNSGATPAAAAAAARGDAQQARFATPERAVEALTAAAKAADTPAMLSIFGPQGRDILSSGDAVADARARDVFVIAAAQKWSLDKTDPNRRELVIGNEEWPFPIPLVRDDQGWRFDTDAGKKEVRARRIGRNELSAIGICETYVIAQKQYAAEGRDGAPAGRYASKIRSTPGRHDGLYWPTQPGERLSPLGDLAAQASSEGYTKADTPTQGPRPFRGYYFRILTRQGPTAPGGAKDYVVDGQMTAGYALIAYPVEYGNSGVMTFIVNQDGVVREADLGPDTAKVAGAITEYDPRDQFKPVE